MVVAIMFVVDVVSMNVRAVAAVGGMDVLVIRDLAG